MGRRQRRRRRAVRQAPSSAGPPRPPAGPKPWQRAIAAVVVAATVVGAVFIVLDLGDADRTSWAKHVTGALALALVPGGLAAFVAAEKVALRVLVAVGWTLGVALIWLGVEHWLNWYAFYNPTHGKGRITTETSARVVGGFVVALGLGALWMWALLLRVLLADRRRAASL